jgi:hypothetical protein
LLVSNKSAAKIIGRADIISPLPSSRKYIQLDHSEDEKPLVWIVEQHRSDFLSPLFIRMMPSAQGAPASLEHLNET